MPFDWMRAIATNRDGLIGIVTRLFVLAGIRTGCPVTVLPRALRIRILAILRPAEFAARRLIVMAACAVEFTLLPSRERGGLPSSSARRETAPPAVDPAPAVNSAQGAALRTFALFDPFKPFCHPWQEAGDEETADAEAGWPAPDIDPGEPVDARAMCRRIVALEAALQDIDGQARRLARWRARRSSETVRPRRWSAMRPGLPPGWRKRPKTPVEEVLKECHSLALCAWNGPDTS